MSDVKLCARPGCKTPLHGPKRPSRRFCSKACQDWAQKRRAGRAPREDSREFGPDTPLLDTPEACAAREARLVRDILAGTPRQALVERFGWWEVTRTARRHGLTVVTGRDALPLGVPSW